MSTTKKATALPLFFAALLITTFGLSAAARAGAATHCVCASGCDDSSIQSAVTAASSGDVLELEPETFLEGNITITKHLTLQTSFGQATVTGGSDNWVFQVSSGRVVTFKMRLGSALSSTQAPKPPLSAALESGHNGQEAHHHEPRSPSGRAGRRFL